MYSIQEEEQKQWSYDKYKSNNNNSSNLNNDYTVLNTKMVEKHKKE